MRLSLIYQTSNYLKPRCR